jgi:hypothetical protein
MSTPDQRTSAPRVSVAASTLVETFRDRCARAAGDYAIGKVALIDAVDSLQDFAFTRGLVDEIGQDQVQAIMAAAFEPVRDDLDLKSGTERTQFPGDEYEGLSSTFAQACALADAGKLPANICGDGNEPTEGLTGEAVGAVQYRNDRAKAHKTLPHKKTEQELAEFWRKVDSPHFDPNYQRHRPVAASTLHAAEYLVQQNDPERFRAWLEGRPAVEREAICEHIENKEGPR